jgi:hypothetical protein
MQNPSVELRQVIRSIVEPDEAATILRNVEANYSRDAILIHPMLNSPPSLGKEGVKSAFECLRLLTIGNKLCFHSVAFDETESDQGRITALIDLTESLTLRPIPPPLRTVIHIRFFIEARLRREEDGLWRVCYQNEWVGSDLVVGAHVAIAICRQTLV